MAAVTENVLERMERIGGMKRIADFRVKQQEYEFKVRYAEKRARVLDYISVGY